MTKKFLFCDVDETLISVKSMFSFHEYWFNNWLPTQCDERQREYEDINAIMRALNRHGTTRKELNRRYYEFFAGRSAVEIKACAEEWFTHVSANTPNFWVTESCNEMRHLRAQGYEPVFVSGSLTEILQPIARSLGIEHILATKLTLSREHFNGRIIPPQMVGTGKATSITMFLAQHDVAGAECAAMGDDGSDIPMLESVGHPIAIVGDPVLSAEATRRGWPRILLNPSVMTA